MITFTTTAISHARTISARHERAARVARHQVVEHGDGREQEQVHDRVAEPPEDALREQRIDPDRRIGGLHHHLDQQRGERQGRDDHVDRDHGERDDGIGDGSTRRREARRDVAEAERRAEARAERASATVRLRREDGHKDREAPGDDRQADQQHGGGEEACRQLRPLRSAIERQGVEKDPRAAEPHRQRRRHDAGDACHHRPVARLRERESGPAKREPRFLQHPPARAHEREPRPAHEGGQSVGRHDRVPRRGRESLDACLALTECAAEEARDEEDRARGQERPQREGSGGGALARHSGLAHGDGAHARRPIVNPSTISWCRRPQYSRQRTT